MKKLISILLITAICITCWGCSSQQRKDTFTVDICQLAPHPALDAATNGFKDVFRLSKDEKMDGEYIKTDEVELTADEFADALK